MRISLASLALPALFVCSTARAQSAPPALVTASEPAPAPVTASPPTPAPAWYGGQLLLSDSLSITAMVSGIVATAVSRDPHAGEAVLSFGTVGYVVAPLAVHAVHGNRSSAATSVALRVLVPVGALALGSIVGLGVGRAGASDPHGGGETFGLVAGATIGWFSGVLTAAAIDDFVLAHEPTKPAEPDSASLRPRVAPAFAPIPGGAAAGIGGVF